MLAVAAVLAAATAGTAAADPPNLYITFRVDRTFAGYLADGTVVGTTSGATSVIPAGTYKLILDDSSGADMEFDLAGPGVKLTTNMSHTEQSNAAYFETFQPSSTYTFRDDNQPSVVWTFATSATVLPASSTTTVACPSCTVPGTTTTGVVGSSVLPSRGRLDATVGPSGAVTFGRPGATLRAGRYTLVVVDRSTAGGLVLQRLHDRKQVMTGGPFTGTRRVALVLTRGTWLYGAGGATRSVVVER